MNLLRRSTLTPATQFTKRGTALASLGAAAVAIPCLVARVALVGQLLLARPFRIITLQLDIVIQEGFWGIHHLLLCKCLATFPHKFGINITWHIAATTAIACL